MAILASVGFEGFLAGVGSRVRKARWLAGMTQQQVAEAAGLTFRHYAELERGRVNPTLRTLYTLARVLHRNVAELVDVGVKRSGVSLGSAKATPPKPGRKKKAR